MKVKIISNIVIEPLSKELLKHIPSVQISPEYCENLIAALTSTPPALLDAFDFVFIHMDGYFHKSDLASLQQVVKGIYKLASQTQSHVVVSNSFVNGYPIGPTSGFTGKNLQFFHEHNDLIKEILELKNTIFFDYQAVLMSIGAREAFNYNLGHLYQMPYTKKMLNHFAEQLSNLLLFYSRPEKKVIVVDCDNTLWKGVVGEDGLDGIKCNLNADGIAYYHLQKFLRLKKDEGFLLCICSKNNFNDVREVFEKKQMPLKWDDFIIKKINWTDKHENLAEIAKELNLGLDSFIFIDDNDFELDSIRRIHPGIRTIKLDAGYPLFLEIENDYSFKRKFLSREDLSKTKQYEQELSRRLERSSHTTFEHYLKSLEIRLDIRKNDIDDFVRLSQITEKTNQFNFNKRIFSPEDLTRFIENGKGLIYSLRASDKHGDYGTVGLIMIETEDGHAVLENFVMSCRVLGRRIENNFFDYVIQNLEEAGSKLTSIRFVKTEKNKPAEEFLKQINHEN